MHLSRLLVVAGAALVIIGCFLPWVSLGGISIAGTAGDGYVAIGLIGIPLLLAVLGDRSGGFGVGKGIAVIVLSALAAGVAFYDMSQIIEGMGTGIGLYLTLFGGAGAAVGGLLGFKK